MTSLHFKGEENSQMGGHHEYGTENWNDFLEGRIMRTIEPYVYQVM